MELWCYESSRHIRLLKCSYHVQANEPHRRKQCGPRRRDEGYWQANEPHQGVLCRVTKRQERRGLSTRAIGIRALGTRCGESFGPVLSPASESPGARRVLG